MNDTGRRDYPDEEMAQEQISITVSTTGGKMAEI